MPEERVSVATLKARLSEYLRRARSGEAVVVTDRGVPVARLGPLAGEVALDGRLEELAAAGLVRRPIRPRWKERRTTSARRSRRRCMAKRWQPHARSPTGAPSSMPAESSTLPQSHRLLQAHRLWIVVFQGRCHFRREGDERLWLLEPSL